MSLTTTVLKSSPSEMIGYFVKLIINRFVIGVPCVGVVVVFARRLRRHIQSPRLNHNLLGLLSVLRHQPFFSSAVDVSVPVRLHQHREHFLVELAEVIHSNHRSLKNRVSSVPSHFRSPFRAAVVGSGPTQSDYGIPTTFLEFLSASTRTRFIASNFGRFSTHLFFCGSDFHLSSVSGVHLF